MGEVHAIKGGAPSGAVEPDAAEVPSARTGEQGYRSRRVSPERRAAKVRFARRLSLCLESLGMSRRQLAERIDVHHSVVAQWCDEGDDLMPSAEIVSDLFPVSLKDALYLAERSERAVARTALPPLAAVAAVVKEASEAIGAALDADADGKWTGEERRHVLRELVDVEQRLATARAALMAGGGA